MTMKELKDFILSEIKGLNELITQQQERLRNEPNRKTNNYKWLSRNISELLSALEVYNGILERINN